MILAFLTYLYVWFKSYLTCRNQRMCFKFFLSNPCNISTGVPQGSILGPLLFIIFINSLSGVVSHCQITMYVDDTALSVNGNDAKDISTKFTSDLHKIMNWLHKN